MADLCNRASPEFDGAACEAAGGVAYGEASAGKQSKPYEQPVGSGNWFVWNSTTGEATPYVEGPYAPLTKDLQDLGLLPLTTDENYYVSSPEATPNAEFSMDPRGNLIDNRYLQRSDPTGPPTSIAQGGELDATERKRVLGSMGLSDAASDPYAGAREARAARAAAIAEAMNAIDLQVMRQKATLAGAQFAAPTDTGGYFPQFGPNSPNVRSGLADPMRFTPVPYNANVGGDAQIAKDLAMIRRAAGVG